MLYGKIVVVGGWWLKSAVSKTADRLPAVVYALRLRGSMQDLDQLSVLDFCQLDAVDVSIEVDEYIPLRVRTYKPPLGGRYVRLGGREKTLLEIILADGANIVRGWTLTSFDGVSEWPDVDLGSEGRAGVPVLAADGLDGGVRRVDLRVPFSVSLRDGMMAIWWGDLRGATCHVFGSLRFLVSNDVLVGLLVDSLTTREVALIGVGISERG